MRELCFKRNAEYTHTNTVHEKNERPMESLLFNLCGKKRCFEVACKQYSPKKIPDCDQCGQSLRIQKNTVHEF